MMTRLRYLSNVVTLELDRGEMYRLRDVYYGVPARRLPHG